MPNFNLEPYEEAQALVAISPAEDIEIDNFATILANLCSYPSPLKKAKFASPQQPSVQPTPTVPVIPAAAVLAVPAPLSPTSVPQVLPPPPTPTAPIPPSPNALVAVSPQPTSVESSPSKLGSLKKKRQRTSPDQLSVLEQIFETDKMPNQQKRLKLAEQLGMSSRRIQIWFQNKRAKVKRVGSKMGESAPTSPSNPEHPADSVPNSPSSALSPPSSPVRESKKQPQQQQQQQQLQQAQTPVQFIYHTTEPFALPTSKDGKAASAPSSQVVLATGKSNNNNYPSFLDARLLDTRLLAAVHDSQQSYPALEQLAPHFGFFQAIPARQHSSSPPASAAAAAAAASYSVKSQTCAASPLPHMSPLDHQNVLLSRTLRLQ